MKTDKHLSTESTLTPQQAEVISALVGGASVTAAMERVGLDRTTHYLWLRSDAGYVAALNSAKAEHLDAVRAKLAGLADAATETIRAMLTGEDVPAQVKLKAALEVLTAVGAMVGEAPGETDAAKLRTAMLMESLFE